MAVLQFNSADGRVEIMMSTANISTPWQRFLGRVKDNARTYCDYSSTIEGLLKLVNPDNDFSFETIDGETNSTDWKQKWPVVYETCRYNTTIRLNGIESKPRIEHQNKEITDRFDSIQIGEHDWLITGELDFLNEPGVFDLAFRYNPLGASERTDHFKFRVVSPKLDAKHDYQAILELVKKEYNDLVFKYLTKTFQNFGRDNRKDDNLLVWYSIFKEIIVGYLKAINFIIHKPHLQTRREVRYSRADRIKRWTPQMSERFAEVEANKRLDETLFRHEIAETTANTRENRFVKFTLERIGSKLGDIIEKVAKLYPGKISKQEIDNLQEQRLTLKKITRNALFRNLHGEPLRNESMVLQKRTGYAQIYRYWLMLQSGIKLLEGTTSIGVRQIWEIYELWCFLKIKQLVCEVLDIDTNNIEQYNALVDERKSSMFDPFAEGELEHQIVFTNPERIGEDEIELLYQHTYNRFSGEIHTATTDNRPDIVLNIKKPDGFMLTYLFDAKYRVFDDDRLNAEGVEDEQRLLGAADYPPSDAINQMHRYRDAIYYGLKKEQQQQHTAKEIIGGYILFPGRGDDAAIKERYFYKSIETVNIGAFPLLPDSQHPEQEAALLKEFLHRIILDNSTYEQLKGSIPQRGLYYTDTKQQALDSRRFFTATVRKRDENYDDFREHKAKQYIIEKQPSVNILDAVYLLPMVAGEIDGYYKITRLTVDDGRICLKLGEYTPLGDHWVNIYRNMRHGELITLQNVDDLYALRSNPPMKPEELEKSLHQ